MKSFGFVCGPRILVYWAKYLHEYILDNKRNHPISDLTINILSKCFVLGKPISLRLRDEVAPQPSPQGLSSDESPGNEVGLSLGMVAFHIDTFFLSLVRKFFILLTR